MRKRLRESLNDKKETAMGWAFTLYCKYLCKNWIKRWFTGERKKMIGFIAYPKYCVSCPWFNKDVIPVYKEMGVLE